MEGDYESGYFSRFHVLKRFLDRSAAEIIFNKPDLTSVNHLAAPEHRMFLRYCPHREYLAEKTFQASFPEKACTPRFYQEPLPKRNRQDR